jgi:thiamine-phosphate pyrophosphorylase
MAAQTHSLMAITCVARFGVDQTLAMAERVCGLATAGSVVVQLRDRELGPRQRLELGRRVREITRRFGQWLCVGERVDLALLLDADALHLPESSPEPTRLRQFLARRGRPRWLSRAVHAGSALPDDCDGWVVAPVAEARKGRPALGFEALAQLSGSVPRGTRVFALGGLGASNAAHCLACGASVAAIDAVYSETERLVDALGIRRAHAAI